MTNVELWIFHRSGEKYQYCFIVIETKNYVTKDRGEAGTRGRDTTDFKSWKDGIADEVAKDLRLKIVERHG